MDGNNFKCWTRSNVFFALLFTDTYSNVVDVIESKERGIQIEIVRENKYEVKDIMFYNNVQVIL